MNPIVSPENTQFAEPCPWVILVHYGSPELTQRCLRALQALDPHPHAVIVVDHGPGFGLGSALEGCHPRMQVLPNLSNPGFGAGCNRGAEVALAAGATALWFLNNDALLEGPTLGRLEALALAHPDVALWGTGQLERGQVLGCDQQRSWFRESTAHPPQGLPQGCRPVSAQESLSGASLYISREAWQRLGPWPEDCFLYWEDSAWCRRAHQLGLGMALSDMAVLHERSSTIGRRSPLSTFYGVRNQLWLHAQIHPEAAGERLGMAFNLLQKRFFQGRFNMLKPTWDGIRAAFRGQRGRDPRY